jgi:hypothetical protein
LAGHLTSPPILRRARETIREVVPEVISPAEQERFLIQLPAAGKLPGIQSQAADEVKAPLNQRDPAVEQVAAVSRQPTEAKAAAQPLPSERPERPGTATVPVPSPSRFRPGAPRPTQASRPTAPKPPVGKTPVAPEQHMVRTGSAPATDRESCEIALWRGYRKANLYARVLDDSGKPLALAESPSFRARGNGTLERTEEAVAAHKALCRQLEGVGWKHVGRRESWYSAVYERDR